MAQSGARTAGTKETGTSSGRGGVDTKDDGRETGMTPAQWYCLLAGAALLLAGLLGFIADSNFDTGERIDGSKLLGIFEVNGFHNLVHIASGLVLLAAFRKRTPAKTIALAFGAVYGLVTIIGLIDGSDILGLIPINPADNVLHIALSLAGILAGLVSPREEGLRTSTAPATGTGTTTERTVGTESPRGERFDRTLDPRDMNPSDRGEERTNR